MTRMQKFMFRPYQNELDELFDSQKKGSDGTKVLLGDLNRDGNVNMLDLQPFADLLASGGHQAEADFNQDGVVNLKDVDYFVELLADN